MDALTDIIGLLRPRTVLLGSMAAAGRWGLTMPPQPGPTFFFVAEGHCWYRPDDGETIALGQGDYVLSARPQSDTFFSEPGVPTDLSNDAHKARHKVDGEMWLGDLSGPPDTRKIGGLILCDPANADLLLGLLPRFIHVRASDAAAARIAALLTMIRDEVAGAAAGRDAILARLIEVMLIATLRSQTLVWPAHAGVLHGLADPRLARALAEIHGNVGRSWTVGALAARSGMSRSAFARRFAEAIGASPVEYLLGWRMAIAKDALMNSRDTLEEIAARVGYKSASAFSTAFSHRVGCPPSDYAARFRAGEANAGRRSLRVG